MTSWVYFWIFAISQVVMTVMVQIYMIQQLFQFHFIAALKALVLIWIMAGLTALLYGFFWLNGKVCKRFNVHQLN